MPSEFLHFPPAYTVVGLYRLLTDPSIRKPVLDKVKHASVRGAIVALVYAAGSWRFLDWFIRKFLVGGGSFFRLGKGRVGEAVKESRRGQVHVGIGGLGLDVDLVFCGFHERKRSPIRAKVRHPSPDLTAPNILHPQILHLQESQDCKIPSLRFDRSE